MSAQQGELREGIWCLSISMASLSPSPAPASLSHLLPSFDVHVDWTDVLYGRALLCVLHYMCVYHQAAGNGYLQVSSTSHGHLPTGKHGLVCIQSTCAVSSIRHAAQAGRWAKARLPDFLNCMEAAQGRMDSSIHGLDAWANARLQSDSSRPGRPNSQARPNRVNAENLAWNSSLSPPSAA